MKQQTYKKSFVIGVGAIGVITGIAAGFFLAHRTMGNMIIGKGVVLAAPERTDEMGKADTLVSAERAGEAGDMKQMEMQAGAMQGMPGMSEGPSGAVVVAAVARPWF